MGLGSTAKKIQKVADTAEDLYGRLNDVRDQVQEMQQTTIQTKERVDSLEHEIVEQRAILEAVANEQGIDLEAATATAHIDDAEDETTGAEDATTGAEGTTADAQSKAASEDTATDVE